MQYIHDKKVHYKKWKCIGFGEIRKRSQYPAEEAGTDFLLIIAVKNYAEIEN